MKRSIIFLTSMFMLASTTLFAQTNRFSVGLISSHYMNRTSDHYISEADNPRSFGLSFGVKMDEHVSFAAAASYLNGDLKHEQGEETSYRAYAAMFFYPLQTKAIKPYLSGGMVYMNQKLDYTNAENETNDVFQFRYSVGVDYPFAPGVALNVDYALYHDIFNVIGTAPSVGLRFMF